MTDTVLKLPLRAEYEPDMGMALVRDSGGYLVAEVKWDELFDGNRETYAASCDRLQQKSAELVALVNSAADLRAEVTRLREALEKHGQHPASCPSRMPSLIEQPCNCGLSAALATHRDSP